MYVTLEVDVFDLSTLRAALIGHIDSREDSAAVYEARGDDEMMLLCRREQAHAEALLEYVKKKDDEAHAQG